MLGVLGLSINETSTGADEAESTSFLVVDPDEFKHRERSFRGGVQGLVETGLKVSNFLVKCADGFFLPCLNWCVLCKKDCWEEGERY